MREYLRSGADTKFRRRLEADAKSLYGLYQYGRLHGCVRLRWGFLDRCCPRRGFIEMSPRCTTC